MTPGSWLAFAAVGIPAIAALVVGLRNTSTTRQTANRSASLEEFDLLRIALRAELNEAKADVKDALARIDALEGDVAEERTKREKAEARATAAEDRAASAERSVQRLQRRVTQLETVLREHDMSVPPEEP